jgi:hypothetical protein
MQVKLDVQLHKDTKNVFWKKELNLSARIFPDTCIAEGVYFM